MGQQNKEDRLMMDKRKIECTVDKISVEQHISCVKSGAYIPPNRTECRQAGRQAGLLIADKIQVKLELAVDQNNGISTMFSQGTALLQNFNPFLTLLLGKHNFIVALYKV